MTEPARTGVGGRVLAPLRAAALALVRRGGPTLARTMFLLLVLVLVATSVVAAVGVSQHWASGLLVVVLVIGAVLSLVAGAWLLGEVQRLNVRPPAVTTPRRTWRRPLSRLREHFQMANETRLAPKPLENWPVDRPSGKPLISVVVTAYNCAPLLAQTLSSLQQQDFDDWECVVVDDGSTDHTFDVACKFAVDDGRFTVVYEPNGGLSHARNTGLLAAQADLVTFLDGDDVLFPSSLSTRLAQIRQASDDTVAGAYCDWTTFQGEEPPFLPEGKPRALQSVTALSSPWDCPFIASAPLVRRDVVTAMGGFDESLATAEDADLWTRMMRAGYAFRYAPYIGIGYRQLPKGMIRRTAGAHAQIMQSVAERAERPIDDPAILQGPVPMSAPLSEYVRHHAMSSRMVRFLVIALAAGDRPGAERIADTLDPVALKLHPDPRFVSKAINAALARMGMLDEQHAQRAAELTAQARKLLDEVIARPVASLPTQAPAEPPARAACDLRSRAPIDDPQSPVKPVAAHLLLHTPGEELEGARDAVVLLPESRYHVDELGPISDELLRRGHKTLFMARQAGRLRSQVLREISKYVTHAWDWDENLPERVPIAGVVTLNDWGPGRDLIMSAQRTGAATFAKVEGVQDFGDLDTGKSRRPYRTADIVLGQGPNDAQVLVDRDVQVVGNYRLEQIWRHEPRRTWLPRAAINLNFTYDVQTEHANAWLRSVVDACWLAGVDYRISPHPAQGADPFDADLLSRKIAAAPMRYMLQESGVLVTRFSTVIYESIARGVPVIYHNPHGEKVWEQMPGYGTAIIVTRTTKELVDALGEAERIAPGYREQATEFFMQQVDVDSGRAAHLRAADAIEAAISTKSR